MTQTNYLWTPAPAPSLAVRGLEGRFPANRIFCAGRNYHAHAVETGHLVDKSAFYFTTAASALVASGAIVPYPAGTSNDHYGMELVVAIGAAGFRVTEADAAHPIFGYAAGLDMTRRDLQRVARDQGRPWDLGKDFEKSAVCTDIVPQGNLGVLTSAAIKLQVNGQTKQSGDLIYTGTSEGVGAVLTGDVALTIGAAE